MTPDTLSGGFMNAPVQSARAFRVLLDVLARPGRIAPITGAVAPAPVSVAAGTALMVLADPTTPVHLAGASDTPAMRDWIRFHIGAPLVAAPDAMIALGTWDALQPVDSFAIGQPDYPDRAATLIIEQDTLAPTGARLTGPGIEDVAFLNLPELAAFQRNAANFPLGFDCFLTAGDQIAGLPRSTRVGAV